ncbi:hypothetical protein LY90DRAFT_665888 [Neocallimastix californiae]|jgi:hypothetical protein|uniref:Uncharacterized protein n=1 Tax=Neocallimastix californiae TaxID=1754190 RepID=A0A1Y2EWT3_9FUNG|nr:hypothetical protein LY90DRAFT_665888 [Neocallimastix californiae]|eukprot:ORY75596.1 hypothetical protein LY90DRAFT_665888 [Neocallimastix californiae]
MHWFYGLLLMGFIFYLILKKLPDPPKENETSKREVHTSNSKSKKKKNKKSKAKTQAQVQAKLNQKIQKKNTPPKGKTNELDENEWPSLEKINEDKKAATKEKSRKRKEKQINKESEFKITHYDDDNLENNSNNNSNSNVDDDYSENEVKKSSDKPIVIQNVSLPITNRKKYKKHVVQENQKYISSDDEEISDREVKVVRVVEKKEEIENIELPPEIDGWKNVVPKKANILVIKSASHPTPVVVKSTIRKPKEEPLTKKQKENKKKAEKRKLEKQRERELQEERLRLYRLEQKKQNIGYKYVAPPKPKSSNTVNTKSKSPAPAPIINSSTNKKSKNQNNNGLISAKVPANGITSLWN